MQQRVALARALVNLPKVLLLDEPLGALDLKLRKGLQVELKRIQREVGITFVYVTHDQEEALTMCDRIAVMNRGHVEQVSIPEEVYDRPTTSFVAGFIGVSNLMPATVSGPGRVKLDSRARGRRRHRRARPRRRLRRGGAAGEAEGDVAGGGAGARTDEPRVEGIVESSLYLGTATQIVVNLGGEVRMTVLIPNADESERQRLPGGGAKVTLSWAPEHMHVVTESPHGEAPAQYDGAAWGRRGNAAGGGPPRRGVAALAAAIGLAACASGIEGPVETTAAKVELEKKASGSLDDLQLAALHRQKDGPETSKRRPASRSNTTKTSTRTKNSSTSCSRSWPTGESGGRSILVLADYMVAKMIKLGYLEELEPAALPEVKANLAKNLRDAPFDPERKYSVPWQSGMTGIIVNKEKAPDVHSICDLFDPKYKGKVDFLNEVRETVPLVMKCEGVDLEKATEADWLKAIEKLKGAADDGQISRFTGNDYAQDLTSGNAVAVMGWSGDAVQLQADNPDLEWRMPTEGCMLWSEDMIIPVGAPNPTAAEAFMNYVYKPEVQARHRRLRELRNPGRRRPGSPPEDGTGSRGKPPDLPQPLLHQECSPTPTLEGAEEKNVIKAFDEVLNG